MIRNYTYEAEVHDAEDRQATLKGNVTGHLGDGSVFSETMRHIFLSLTAGRAVFGSPGVGCKGPYHITKITIEED